MLRKKLGIKPWLSPTLPRNKCRDSEEFPVTKHGIRIRFCCHRSHHRGWSRLRLLSSKQTHTSLSSFSHTHTKTRNHTEGNIPTFNPTTREDRREPNRLFRPNTKAASAALTTAALSPSRPDYFHSLHVSTPTLHSLLRNNSWICFLNVFF